MAFFGYAKVRFPGRVFATLTPKPNPILVSTSEPPIRVPGCAFPTKVSVYVVMFHEDEGAKNQGTFSAASH